MQSRNSESCSRPLWKTYSVFLALAASVCVFVMSSRTYAQCVPVGVPCPPPGGFRSNFSPARLAGGGTFRGLPPVLADLGLTPGRKSIVFGTSNGRLYVVKDDGSTAAGFPVTLPREIVSSPAVGVLTLPNLTQVLAVVVGYGSQWPGQDDAGGLRAYRTDGTLLWEKLTGPLFGATAPVVSAPTIADIDGDGKNEVVWTGLDNFVHVSDGGTGVEKTGWPFATHDTIFSSPAVFDLDGDGRLEVIVGSDQHFEPQPIGTPDGGGLYVLRSDGALYPGYPKYFDQVISSSPAIGDIDGDGKPEIVVGTGSFWPGAAHRVYAFRCDGSAVANWPVTVQGQVITSPALADLTGDGVPEVIVTDDLTGPDGKPRCYAFRGNGTQLFTPVVVKDYFGQSLNAGEPVVGDVLGDAALEILVPTNGEICVISNTGVQLTDDGSHGSGKFSFMAVNLTSGVSGTELHAIAGDLESDGQKIEVVAVTGINSSSDAGVWIWNPKAPTLPLPWGMFHYDALHRGVVPGTPNCSTPTRLHTLPPCRLIDTRGITPGAVGGPALSANEVRSFTLTSLCGVPSTAKALSVNATATAPGASGWISMFPGSHTQVPTATSLSFSPGLTRANNGIVLLAGDGSLKVANVSAAALHFILDVNGYFQ